MNQERWENEDDWLKNDFSSFPPGGAKMRNPLNCPKQSINDGYGTPLYKVVEEYANDQDKWVKDFLIALRKVQHNGYAQGHLINGPNVFNKCVTCIYEGGVMVCKPPSAGCTYDTSTYAAADLRPQPSGPNSKSPAVGFALSVWV